MFLRLLLSSVLCIAALPAQAQELDFADTESRIDYAWFTEDANALRTLIQSIRASAQKTVDTPESHYLTALAYYRLGALLAPSNPSDGATSMTQCVEDADKVTDAGPKSAEALALQAICYTHLAELQSWKSMVNSPLAALKMEKALKLAPANPRVALLDAVRDYARAKPAEKAQTLTKFRRALELFESAPASTENASTWGYADAYAYVGRCLQEKDDLLGARNAYERALIAAPDYAKVRRELQALLSK